MKKMFALLALLSVLAVTSCAKEEPVIDEDMLVRLNYTGTLDDGSVFDSSEGRDPLEFVFGAGMIIPGLEEGIKGLKAGDTKVVTVQAEDAYGPYDNTAIMEVPKEQLPPDMQLEEGMQLAAQGPQGPIPVVVKEIKESSVMIDFNHPLAGKSLTFDVQIVEVRAQDDTSEDTQQSEGTQQ